MNPSLINYCVLVTFKTKDSTINVNFRCAASDEYSARYQAWRHVIALGHGHEGTFSFEVEEEATDATHT
jgi:DNA-binding LacI/PurR family transcriptional regulator